MLEGRPFGLILICLPVEGADAVKKRGWARAHLPLVEVLVKVWSHGEDGTDEVLGDVVVEFDHGWDGLRGASACWGR